VVDVPVGPVTVRPCATFNGCTIAYGDVNLTGADEYIHKSPRQWPAHVRQSLENYIMIKLAGPIAATMAPPGELAGDPFAGEHWAHPDVDWPGPTGLTPAEQNALAAAAATPSEGTDAELAAAMAWDMFAGAERAAWRHSRWLAEETTLVLEHNRDALARVANALFEHRVLGSADVRRLVAGG
jgi:hypothetical protein